MILSKISVLWKKQSPSYVVLERSPNWKEAKTARKVRSFNCPSAITLLLLLGAFSLSVTSFLVGHHYSRDGFVDLIKLETVSRVFEYNNSFGGRPSPQTNQAWNKLFPIQGGFFRHPQIAPERSALSVFHQLHCLNGMRQAYWTAYRAAAEGRKMSDDDYEEMISPAHVQHCTDLLRQTLMCQPDLTIELKNEQGGVEGFGTDHRCKDWAQLMHWTAQWETYGQSEPWHQPEHGHVHGSHIH